MKTLKILSVLCITTLFFSCDSYDDIASAGTIDLETTSITFSIVKDHNDQNNDSDLTNNQLAISGSGINDLFRN
ncbi:hypothetical protein [uncultured Aquimarina sp.]|uniref:hypothetical protein n=1 Tax=uncultured Aquimarina sp. TaxID=575652 RepID=UPI00261792EA|nr:hypothetical protein [uncultured Aquimarina sp.]